MSESEKCPECKSECTRDVVDNGVGNQYGPWRCDNCGWSEQSEWDAWLKSLTCQR